MYASLCMNIDTSVTNYITAHGCWSFAAELESSHEYRVIHSHFIIHELISSVTNIIRKMLLHVTVLKAASQMTLNMNQCGNKGLQQ